MGQNDRAPSRSGAAGTRQRLVSLQYLRGFGAPIIIVSHAFQWTLPTMNMPLLQAGRLWVDVFFVISGFIMVVIAKDGPFDPIDFAKRRAIRILPAYWIATALLTVLALAMPSQFRTTVPTVEGFLKSLFFIPSLDPKAPLLLLGWTLNFEAFFYLVFGALFFLGSKARTATLCAIFGGLVALGTTLENPGHLAAFYTSPTLMGFLVGTLVGQAYRYGWLDARGWRTSLAVGLAMFAGYHVFPWPDQEHVGLGPHLFMTLTAAAVVVAALKVEDAARLPKAPSLGLLGDASYSIYLFHMFPVAAIWAVAKRVVDVDGAVAYWCIGSFAVVVGLAFGIACYWVIERPLLQGWRPWRTAAPMPQAAPAR